MSDTTSKAEQLITKKAKKTIEQVNDSEPFYLHQGEILELMEEYATLVASERMTKEGEQLDLKKEFDKLNEWLLDNMADERWYDIRKIQQQLEAILSLPVSPPAAVEKDVDAFVNYLERDDIQSQIYDEASKTGVINFNMWKALFKHSK